MLGIASPTTPFRHPLTPLASFNLLQYRCSLLESRRRAQSRPLRLPWILLSPVLLLGNPILNEGLGSIPLNLERINLFCRLTCSRKISNPPLVPKSGISWTKRRMQLRPLVQLNRGRVSCPSSNRRNRGTIISLPATRIVFHRCIPGTSF